MTKAIVEAVIAAHYKDWQPAPAHFTYHWGRSVPASGVVHGYYLNTKGESRLEGMIGFKTVPGPEETDNLARQADLLMKTLYALTDSHERSGDGVPGLFTALDIPDLMDRLGYQRLGNGAHRTENRKSVLRILQLLSTIQVSIFHQIDYALVKHFGPVWHLQPINKPGDPISWESDYIPALEFMPGAWQFKFRETDYFPYGLDKRFMSLRPGDIGRAPILLGGWLAVDTGINRGKPGKRHRIDTLYRWAGLDGLYAKDKRKRWQKLAQALDDLVQTGVIKSWNQVDDERVGIDFSHHPPARETYRWCRKGEENPGQKRIGGVGENVSVVSEVPCLF